MLQPCRSDSITCVPVEVNNADSVGKSPHGKHTKQPTAAEGGTGAVLFSEPFSGYGFFVRRPQAGGRRTSPQDEPMEQRESFGAVLKRLRVATGLTHEALAERSNLGARTISDLERGVSRSPRADTLALLMDAL